MRPSPRTSPSPAGHIHVGHSRRDERGLVVPTRLMLVAVVVVALGAALYLATSPTSPKQTAPAAHQPASSSAEVSPTSSPSVSATSTSPTPKPSRSTPSPATPSKSATAKPTPTATVPAAAVRRAATFVEVFNNTKRKGLAGRAAKRAEGAGWKVVGSDNWYGTIPTSTVYYPRQYARAARVLARDMGISRVEPAVAPMRNDRLTVILTSGYRVR